jgi:hypothetical protein
LRCIDVLDPRAEGGQHTASRHVFLIEYRNGYTTTAAAKDDSFAFEEGSKSVDSRKQEDPTHDFTQFLPPEQADKGLPEVFLAPVPTEALVQFL